MEEFQIECKSFGFKHSEEIEADYVFDVRCLPNPFYVEELRDKTGLEAKVQDYVMASFESQEFFKRLQSFMDFALPLHKKDGKKKLTLAFGCTGGRHRSVTIAELLGEHFKNQGFKCVVTHRDINKR